MIHGLGCDIVRIQRLTPWCFSNSLLMRVFTSSEIALLPSFIREQNTEKVSSAHIHRASEQLAGMFSAKEAYKKAVSNGYGKTVYMKDIIIEKNANGSPRLRLERSAAKALVACCASYALVSISHEKEYAVATVMVGS